MFRKMRAPLLALAAGVSVAVVPVALAQTTTAPLSPYETTPTTTGAQPTSTVTVTKTTTVAGSTKRPTVTVKTPVYRTTTVPGTRTPVRDPVITPAPPSQSLAYTGGEVWRGIGAGLVLLLAATALVVVPRRRRRAGI